jgi:deoxyinosine 3'endonuclease (endonuclease V)
MILAIDVHYRNHTAKVVCAVLQQWKDPLAVHYHIKYVDAVAEYIPGEFYKRELPCILAILEEVDLTTVSCIVIDGFVVLDDTGKYGLGGHLYESLDRKVPVIGVAKSNFHQNIKHVIPVYRGESDKPLYITAIGTDLQQAADDIQAMYGDYRMPAVLKELDRKTKEDDPS